jgi:DUF1680 family protein
MSKMRAVTYNLVQLTGGFWQRWQEINRTATLSIEHRQCRDTGRLAAFKMTWKPNDPAWGFPEAPHIFWDSDVGKWIEAAAYSLATHPDRQLEAQVDEVIALMAKGQAPDGYLNTHFQQVEPEKRFTNLRDLHELEWHFHKPQVFTSKRVRAS